VNQQATTIVIHNLQLEDLIILPAFLSQLPGPFNLSLIIQGRDALSWDQFLVRFPIGPTCLWLYAETAPDFLSLRRRRSNRGSLPFLQKCLPIVLSWRCLSKISTQLRFAIHGSPFSFKNLFENSITDKLPVPVSNTMLLKSLLFHLLPFSLGNG
jgi:hypothetical protein